MKIYRIDGVYRKLISKTHMELNSICITIHNGYSKIILSEIILSGFYLDISFNAFREETYRTLYTRYNKHSLNRNKDVSFESIGNGELL